MFTHWCSSTDLQKMPYIHYEFFDNQKNTRAIIQDVTRSKAISENAGQNNSAEHPGNPFADLKKGPSDDNDSSTESSNELSSSSLPPTIEVVRRQLQQLKTLVHGLNERTAISSISNSTSKREKSLIKGYLHHSPPLHIRRSLDEFFYSSLVGDKILQRDRNQIVFTTFEEGKDKISYLEQGSKLPVNSLGAVVVEFGDLDQYEEHFPRMSTGKDVQEHRKGNHPIVMVDQLWMWIIGSGTSSLKSHVKVYNAKFARHSDYKFSGKLCRASGAPDDIKGRKQSKQGNTFDYQHVGYYHAGFE